MSLLHRRRWQRYGSPNPKTVNDLQVWWQAADLMMADGDNPTPWNPHVNNTAQAFSLTDAGTNASYDLTTFPVAGVDFTGSSGAEDSIRDSVGLCRGAGEGMLVAFTYQSTDITNASIFSLCGFGAASAGTSGFRGFDFNSVITTGVMQFRTKGSDNLTRNADTSSGLVNDTPYVIIGVLDSDDSMHIWANGLLHGTATQTLSIKHTTTAHDLQLGTLVGGSTTWSPPAVMTDWVNYVRAGAILNSEVNMIGRYLANRIDATWTAVTDLAG